MRYFLSDTHFGHGNIIRFCDRPFRSVEEMDDAMVRNWNRTVRPEDEVVFGGDFALADFDRSRELCGRLSGYKILVRGNHDGTDERMMRIGFDEVHDRLELTEPDGPGKILVVHRPSDAGTGDGYAAVLYGHSHNAWFDPRERFYSMTAEINRYRPQTLEGIIENNLRKSLRRPRILHKP
jgi:calcineurin-like phosphoesterase family protein